MSSRSPAGSTDWSPRPGDAPSSTLDPTPHCRRSLVARAPRHAPPARTGRARGGTAAHVDFDAPVATHRICRARSSTGNVSVMRRRPWYVPGDRDVTVAHVERRVAGHERGRVAVGPEPRWIRSNRSGRSAAYAAAACRERRVVGGIDPVDRHRTDAGATRLGQRRRSGGSRPRVVVTERRDPFVHLPDARAPPRDVFVGEGGEHRPRRRAARYGDRAGPARVHRRPARGGEHRRTAARSTARGSVLDVDRDPNRGGIGAHELCSAWPPNSLRIADRTRLAKSASPRESRPREQRRGQRGCRDALFDRGDRGPAPLAGIAHPPGEPLEVRRFVQRRGGQVEQPRRHDAPAPPHLGDLRNVDRESIPLRVLEGVVSASRARSVARVGVPWSTFSPSASAAISPYSIPLCTIFTK